jgi:hypothetical protein
MLELGMSGSVRGVSSNGHPYRDPGPFADIPPACEIEPLQHRAFQNAERF